MALLTGQPRTATVVALDDVRRRLPVARRLRGPRDAPSGGAQRVPAPRAAAAAAHAARARADRALRRRSTPRRSADLEAQLEWARARRRRDAVPRGRSRRRRLHRRQRAAARDGGRRGRAGRRARASRRPGAARAVGEVALLTGEPRAATVTRGARQRPPAAVAAPRSTAARAPSARDDADRARGGEAPAATSQHAQRRRADLVRARPARGDRRPAARRSPIGSRASSMRAPRGRPDARCCSTAPTSTACSRGRASRRRRTTASCTSRSSRGCPRTSATTRYLVLCADAGDTEWTRRCLRQRRPRAVVARAGDDPCAAGRRGARSTSSASRARCELVLVHPDDATRAVGHRCLARGARASLRTTTCGSATTPTCGGSRAAPAVAPRTGAGRRRRARLRAHRRAARARRGRHRDRHDRRHEHRRG